MSGVEPWQLHAVHQDVRALKATLGGVSSDVASANTDHHVLVQRVVHLEQQVIDLQQQMDRVMHQKYDAPSCGGHALDSAHGCGLIEALGPASAVVSGKVTPWLVWVTEEGKPRLWDPTGVAPGEWQQ